MLTEHPGMPLWLLLSVAGHAAVLERLLGRDPAQAPVRVAILLAPVALVFVGEGMYRMYRTRPAGRVGLWVAALGASLHLALSLGCGLLPRGEAQVALALGAGGTVVMALSARWSVRGLRTGVAEAPPNLRARPKSLWDQVERTAWLYGGTAISLGLVSLAFVLAGLVGLARHPENWRPLGLAVLFFALCGAVAVSMGQERRRALLSAAGLSSPR